MKSFRDYLRTHVRMTSMTSLVERTDLDFKISVALMFTQKFIKIFHSVQEIHNLLGYILSISGKILSKYSKRFKSYRHFSQTGWH